jgi:hypothetical protein
MYTDAIATLLVSKSNAKDRNTRDKNKSKSINY